MKKVMNNKGFTLVELLAVLVILAAIMGIAIPSITSSMERSKEKQNKSKIKMLESFGELYVADNKNVIYNNLEVSKKTSCHIPISTLKEKGYLTEDADKTVDGDTIIGSIIFNKNNNTYTYTKEVSASQNTCL